MRSATIWFAALLPMLCLAARAPADTVTTADGQKLSGQPLEETEEHLRLRGKYGVLTIPKKEIKKREVATYLVEMKDGTRLEGRVLGESAEKLRLKSADAEKEVALAEVKSVEEKPAERPPAGPPTREIAALHLKARQLWDRKEYAKAVEEYARLLALDPDDTIALYNTACGYALTGERARALEFLRKSLEAGFVDFPHVEADTDLDSLREEPAYKELLGRRAEFTRSAAAKAVERIGKGLAVRGVDARAYRQHVDERNNFVYLHTRSDEEFASIRQGLEEYAEYQWKHLFQNRPGRPLYIVLLNAKDTPKALPRGVGGYFNSGMNALVCGDSAAYRLLRSSVTVHEFTHALHRADMAVRRQEHPIWLVEGLATLFETSERAPDKVVPLHNHRLAVIQEAIRRGRFLPWKTITAMTQPQFMASAQLAYAQSRYMLYYMNEKGLLKRFYDEYTKGEGYANDRTAADAYEVVFGKPLAEVESDWRKWVLEQKVPVLPFLGVTTKAGGDDGAPVEAVSPGSPAEKAGLRPGDLIASIGGQAVKGPDDVVTAVGAHQPGEEVEVEVLRGEERQKLAVVLGKRPGLTPGPRPAPAQAYLGLAVGERGGKLLVKEVAPDSPAAAAGLEVGMEVLEISGAKVANARAFLAAAKKAKPGDELGILVRTADGEKKLTARVVEMPAGR